MKIEVYATCWNEAEVLPFFFRHYSTLARRIIVTDTGSTDASLDIARSFGAEIRYLDTGGEFREDLLMQYRNECWKASAADWVVVCDADELLCAPDWRFLDTTAATLFAPTGWNVFCDEIPADGQIYDAPMFLARETQMDKPILFRPMSIRQMNLGPGSHYADPLGTVLWGNNPDLWMLHLSYLTLERRLSKIRRIRPRLSRINRKHGFATYYGDSDADSTKVFRDHRAKAMRMDLPRSANGLQVTGVENDTRSPAE